MVMGPRIVILDAEPVVRSVAAEILESAGYDVPTLAMRRRRSINTALPDLLVTNVYLPGISGHDTMRLLKGVRPELSVLMVSGLPDSEVIREWTYEDGFDTFPKPFTAQDLLGKVRSILND
jgi:DNA-binding response OmpR family regulator